MNLLEMKNLMVFYENAIGVNNISVQCGKGEITGVFGSNSAGKTTLMFTVSGIILDTARKERMRGGIRITVLGEVLFDGQDVTKTEPSERARKGLDTCARKEEGSSKKARLSKI